MFDIETVASREEALKILNAYEIFWNNMSKNVDWNEAAKIITTLVNKFNITSEEVE